ncbi:hypothetical protein AB6A40_002006 [Gnathostoma spinigerum]|uniref:Acetyl-CoA hydrolase n=1 Tax=Gnathostoma spinigerum TaxID=75299 RepID=A0ABD6E7P1_9BILA
MFLTFTTHCNRAASVLPISRLCAVNIRQQSTRIDSKKVPPRVLIHSIKGKKPNFTSLQDAISLIKSDCDIFVHPFGATPTELLQELCRQVSSGRLTDVRLSHVLHQGDVPWAKPECIGKVRSNCLFIHNSTRQLVKEGKADYTPAFLSDLPRLYINHIIPVDYALVQVSPPDNHGFCSLGCSVDCTFAVCQVADHIIALVNEQMPRTFGDTVIHSSQFDAMVEVNRPIIGKPDSTMKADEDEEKIGKFIADNLIDDGATLQMGIGALPDSCWAAMKNHKNLGVHTELLSDGVIDLVKENVISNACKTIDNGKIVTSLAFGTKEFYEFLDNNPVIEFRSCGYTNNPSIIRQQHKMTSINTVIEMDLTGQSTAESIGASFYSGFGGQLDFAYGAGVTDDGEGKSIIAMTSTTRNGQSKIVPYLKEGAGVVVTRGHVRYVVTEYGVAQLFGRSVRHRAYELIHIAHPQFRESLEKAAFERLKCMPSRD